MKKILIIAANPRGTSQLRLDQEIRGVEEAIRRPQFPDQFEVKQRSAVRLIDLKRAFSALYSGLYRSECGIENN